MLSQQIYTKWNITDHRTKKPWNPFKKSSLSIFLTFIKPIRALNYTKKIIHVAHYEYLDWILKKKLLGLVSTTIP